MIPTSNEKKEIKEEEDGYFCLYFQYHADAVTSACFMSHRLFTWKSRNVTVEMVFEGKRLSSSSFIFLCHVLVIMCHPSLLFFFTFPLFIYSLNSVTEESLPATARLIFQVMWRQKRQPSCNRRQLEVAEGLWKEKTVFEPTFPPSQENF